MKRNIILIGLLVIVLFTFGCTSSSPPSTPVGGSNTSAPASAPPVSQPSGGTQPAVNNTNSMNSSANATAPSTPPVASLSGMNYTGLLYLGSGSQCSVSYTGTTSGPTHAASNTSGNVNMNVYFDGNGSMRIEETTGYSDCPSGVSVFKSDSSGNGTLYLTCPGATVQNTTSNGMTESTYILGSDFNTGSYCAWNSMNVTTDTGGIGSTSLGISDGYSTPDDLVNAPTSAYNCKPWVVDSSKFSVSGDICYI